MLKGDTCEGVHSSLYGLLESKPQRADGQEFVFVQRRCLCAYLLGPEQRRRVCEALAEKHPRFPISRQSSMRVR